MFRTILLVFLAGLSAATVAGAEVGNLGDPQRLAIHGVESYPADELRRALQADWHYQLAARPSAPLEQLLSILEQRLTVGYRLGGFPDATVTAILDEGGRRIDVRVVEGTGYTAGEVRIDGASPAMEHEITARIRGERAGESVRKRVRDSAASYRRPRQETKEESDKQPAFRRGEPISFVNDPAGYRERVADALADLGHCQPRFDVALDFDEAAATADLLVTLDSPGPPATVEQVRVLGLHINQEQPVLDLADVAPQAPLDRELLETVERKLRHCGRFWSYSVQLGRLPTADDPTAGLEIIITECPGLPPLNEPLPPGLEAARRLGIWLDALNDAADDLVIEVESFHDSMGNAKLAASLAVSRQDGLAFEIQGRGDAGWRINHGLVVSNERLTLYAHDRLEMVQVDPQGRLQCQVKGSWEPGDPSFSLKLTLTFKSREKSLLRLAVHPVIFVHMAQRADASVHVADGRMTLECKDIRFTADTETGRLVRWQMVQDGRITAEVRLAVRPREVLRRTESFDDVSRNYDSGVEAVDSYHAFVSFALGEIAHQAALTRSEESALQIHSLTADLDERFRAWRKSLAPRLTARREDTHQPRFTIQPVDIGLDTVMQLPRFGFSAADELFPRGGAAWTLLRECCFGLVDRGGPPQWEELRRLINAGEIGPIGCLLAAQLFGSESTGPAKHIARLGLARMDEEHVRREFHAVFLDQERTSHAVNTAGRVLRWIPGDIRREALARLPNSTESILDAWSHELERAPDADPADVLVEVLVREWHECLAGIVRARLEWYAHASDSTARR